MGVPALFRWLSKKYPKIILPVLEEEEAKVPDAVGDEIAIPVDISGPNPNGEEFDNLYLDMNGIPAPETEEEMMVEIFAYTERVVNMIRPRKLLFMAIAMGKIISDEEKDKKSWDSNAITPGTPFMHLLAESLRYWVARKLNTDPGWKTMEVIISDASVPGEGEHKIMDFIRRQRSNPGHNPNTRHVIYGLDADLIMLSLATHEPHFRVLREDVFFQEGSRTACRMCGQEGHYAAQCTAEKAEVKKTPPEKKPFIFLDVAILREYLEAELRMTQLGFPFNLEQAIDDWVLLIFLVGNDFLPHLPSLEIREGAIDTLLKIWRDELPRMGGYITNHGQLVLERVQIMLEGLAKREDDIFRRRREAEERQNQNTKRRKIEKDMGSNETGPSSTLNLTAEPTAPSSLTGHASLPSKPLPSNSFAATADSIGLGGPKTSETAQLAPAAALALAGSNRDVVANRRAIRMANMSAAEMLKAELSGLVPLKPSKTSETSQVLPAAQDSAMTDDFVAPGLDVASLTSNPSNDALAPLPDDVTVIDKSPANGLASKENAADAFLHGVKRKIDEVDEDAVEEGLGSDADDAPPDAEPTYTLKVNIDGSVDQDDTVKLWEPGYRERYYRQKFGTEEADTAFKKELTLRYVEGMAWVLQYYYQGTPSWTWYYPYHFAPFAADFDDVKSMDIKFTLGQPFKPFEQLMGVFPAASRQHIPAVFHNLMTDEDSSIIDFYPTTFQIDMNGKKMVWQGVALLPFIDEIRLLGAMGPEYHKLTDEEKRRNEWGNDVIYAFEEHPLYPSLEALYGKRKDKENDRSLSALYFFPKQLTPHRSVLLPGIVRNKPVLTDADREGARRGGRGRGRGGYDNRNRGGSSYGGQPSYSDGKSNGYGGRGGHSDYQRSSYNNDSSGQRSNAYGTSYQQSSYPSSYQSQPSYPPRQTYDAYNNNSRGGPPQGYNSYGGGGRGRGGPPGGPPRYSDTSYQSQRGGYDSGPSRGG
ncbi:hypothetical protein EUX98_g365 [Antrodiella citrinella]|uniref:5'-3' exoribonuclease n=1 Tax=Antrodiella citrinella TaxID=2447956 RepID=A0A4S4NCM9_9APHY|nr:hypothetical protein EUX98_g365 [Antrodiella citrinella]